MMDHELQIVRLELEWSGRVSSARNSQLFKAVDYLIDRAKQDDIGTDAALELLKAAKFLLGEDAE